jgi:arabinoxylan arabinofuranohydrolase
MIKLRFLSGILWLLAGALPVLADYPVMSHRHLADPSTLVHGGRVYVYCSNDDDSPLAGGYEMKSLVCVSSSDMKNWTDHGEVIRVPRDASWAAHTWAPAAIERNGTFFLYFSNNASGIGVATSDSPTGPFKDALGRALINASTPGVLPAQNMWIFDPGVFIDHDGQAYLYFGGNGESNLRIIRLKEDMISVEGAAMPVTVQNFFEAAFMHERNGRYYLSYSTTPAAGLRIDYLTADSPIGPFTYAGIVAPQPPSNNNNNHAAIFELNGQWYHIYHNRFVAMEAGIPPVYRRNLGVELMTYHDDGRIRQVVHTRDGVPQAHSLNPYERVEAETFNAQSGIKTAPGPDGSLHVADLQNGDWVRLRGVDFGAGATRFRARVASAGGGGQIVLRLGTPTGTIIGTCAVVSTGGAQSWTTVETGVTGAAGVNDLYLQFTGEGSSLFNFDWWQFVPAEGVRITVQPRNLTVAPGQRAGFWVQVNNPSLVRTFQWLRDGQPIDGATRSSFQLAAVEAGHAGEYSVVVSHDDGTVASATARLRVEEGATAELMNLSVRAQVEAGAVLIPGFILQPGDSATDGPQP